MSGALPYLVKFKIDGLTQEMSKTVSTTLQMNNPDFEDAIRDELQDEYPGQPVVVEDVTALANLPAKKPKDSFYGILFTIVALMVLATVGLICFGYSQGI